jgi:hypothetical protein
LADRDEEEREERVIKNMINELWWRFSVQLNHSESSTLQTCLSNGCVLQGGVEGWRESSRDERKGG